MPANIIKSFAKKSGKSEKEVEKLWNKAKSLTKKEYPKVQEDSERFYKIVTGMLKKMLGLYNIKEETTAAAIPSEPVKVMGSPCFDVEDELFWKLHNKARNHRQWYNKFYQDTRVAEYARKNPGSRFFIKHKDLGFVREIKRG